jgi:hypothetical protein
MAMKRKANHYGSPKETGRIHAGEVKGTNEMPAVGPGRAAMRTNTKGFEAIPGPAASGATPKGMSVQREGE